MPGIGTVISGKCSWVGKEGGGGGFGTHASFAIGGSLHILVAFLDQHDEVWLQGTVGCLFQVGLWYEREREHVHW